LDCNVFLDKGEDKTMNEYNVIQAYIILDPSNWKQIVEEEPENKNQIVVVSSQRNIEKMVILKDTLDHLSNSAQEILFYVLNNRDIFYTRKDEISKNIINKKRIERLFYKKWHNRRKVLSAIKEIEQFVLSF
jgi:hypothetical protein